jgi:hypothetical protein
VTDEAAADQFVAAANAFRMQKMGTEYRVASDSLLLGLRLSGIKLIQIRQGSW